MLQSSVYFFSQVKAGVPVAMEEIMITVLAKNDGINIRQKIFQNIKKHYLHAYLDKTNKN